MLHLIITLFLTLAVPLKPADIPNPNTTDRRVYVADPSGLVDPRAEETANAMLYNLRLKTGAEVAVVVVESLGDIPIEDYAQQLFTDWGIGKGDKDNGVLVLISEADRKARIHTGYGVEGIIPDISAAKIIRRSIAPHMKEGDVSGAVTAVAADLSAIMLDPAAAEELKSSEKEAWDADDEKLLEALENLAKGTVIALGAAAWILLFATISKNRRRDRYAKAMAWHKRRSAFIILAACSLGIGLPAALLALWLARRTRNKPLKCSVCGAKMHKLSEDEDNEFLTSSQDLEEQLKTVDYDVWECPKCGSTDRYAFRADQTKYTECPKCHTVARCLVHDRMILQPTTRNEGIGEKTYECQYCGHRDHLRYSVARKEDASAAAFAAGAVLGSMGRGHGGGSGFGGGSSGGGGASGGW